MLDDILAEYEEAYTINEYHPGAYLLAGDDDPVQLMVTFKNNSLFIQMGGSTTYLRQERCLQRAIHDLYLVGCIPKPQGQSITLCKQLSDDIPLAYAKKNQDGNVIVPVSLYDNGSVPFATISYSFACNDDEIHQNVNLAMHAGLPGLSTVAFSNALYMQ